MDALWGESVSVLFSKVALQSFCLAADADCLVVRAFAG